MSASQSIHDTAHPEHEEALEGLPPGFGDGLSGKIAFWIAFVFSLFQLFVAAYGTLPSQILRALHVGFLVLLGCVLISNLVMKTKLGKIWYWIVGLAGFATGLYNWIFYTDIIQRTGYLTTADLVTGTVLIVVVFIASRQLMGWPLAIIASLFLAYAAFGEYAPGVFQTRGYDFAQLVENFSFGTEGIYGTPIYVSSSYIFIFVVFAAFLERAGMLNLFNDFALGLVGHLRGGPAQVAVLSSALMGTISGSGVANVVASGQFTIPMMKKFGFKPAFAGGVEATASMGGQIMPPVMGAVAFIMAETLNIPYVEVVKAAIIPAILYFGAAFWMVHLEAGRKGLVGLPKDECPNPWTAVRERWYLLIPLAGLVALLFSGFTPLFSGTVGLALTVILIFGAAVIGGVKGTPLRTLFWVLLGIACAGFLEFGVIAFFVVTLVLVALSFIRNTGGDARKLAIQALVDGARHALPVAIACALVGVIIGVINLTGVAAELGGHIIAIGRESLFLALLLTMLTCLVLGMGIPTIPNYIITSSLAAPVLLELGVPLIVSHMFVFYFGIMADLTPPVALACFAAAPIARETGLKISMQAIRVAIAGFIVPFMAVYAPALMLQSGTWVDTSWIVFKALVAIGMWGAGAIGYLFGPLNWVERIVAIVSASFLVVALPLTDEIGLGAVAVFLAWHWWRTRELRAVAA